MRAGNRIDEKYRDKIHVNVTSYNRMLLLTGEAPSAEIKADIEKLASGVPGVKSISNELAIAGPSSLGGRSNDVYITSKVKARFVDANKFSPNHVKVVTEAGVVFLLGIVTQGEANDAVDIARTTGGVQKVVRVFEIISAEQAKSLDNKPAPAAEAKPADRQIGPAVLNYSRPRPSRPRSSPLSTSPPVLPRCRGRWCSPTAASTSCIAATSPIWRRPARSAHR